MHLILQEYDQDGNGLFDSVAAPKDPPRPSTCTILTRTIQQNNVAAREMK
jgi:hypothetical protein